VRRGSVSRARPGGGGGQGRLAGWLAHGCWPSCRHRHGGVRQAAAQSCHPGRQAAGIGIGPHTNTAMTDRLSWILFAVRAGCGMLCALLVGSYEDSRT
jgi:hypothetical protein